MFFLLLWIVAATLAADPQDLTLFNAPRGGWLGTLRADAPMVVLEEQQGWRRVRIEAWVQSPAGTASDPASPTASPPSAGGSREAVVKGVLRSPLDGAAGGGLIVLLISDLEALNVEHARAGAECKGGLDDLENRLETLRDDKRKALNSSDNFREATTRSDRVASEIRRTESARVELMAECRRSADLLFQRHAVERVITDAEGRFEFSSVPGGRHRVIATLPAADPPLSWSFDCSVEGGDTLVLDPLAHRSSVPPYWDLP
jgi:hypothetical protein